MKRVKRLYGDRRSREFYSNPKTQSFAKLLIDLEESPQARAVVLGELRERKLRGRAPEGPRSGHFLSQLKRHDSRAIL